MGVAKHLALPNMRDELKPAIDALLGDLADQEKQVVDTKLLINRLCLRSGLDVMFPDAAATSSASVASIRPDTFYGKVLNTAAREYLEMRRAANLGPATAREVHEALVKGGYATEAKDENTAIVIVRNTLRKNSSIFHRLPNGTYGLLSWYPNAKAQRPDDGDEEAGARSSSSSKKRGRKAHVRANTPRVPASTGEAVPKAAKIREELRSFLVWGPRSKTDILARMIEKGILGSEADPGANLSTYLSRAKDLVKSDGEGKWMLLRTEAPAAAAVPPREAAE